MNLVNYFWCRVPVREEVGDLASAQQQIIKLEAATGCLAGRWNNAVFSYVKSMFEDVALS